MSTDDGHTLVDEDGNVNITVDGYDVCIPAVELPTLIDLFTNVLPTMWAIARQWIGEDVVPETVAALPPVTVSYTPLEEDPSDGYITYESTGEVRLFVDDPQHFALNLPSDAPGDDPRISDRFSVANLRALIAICDDPRARQWAGLATQPIIQGESVICDDEMDDDDFGEVVGTEFRIGEDTTEVRVFFPLEPNGYGNNVPVITIGQEMYLHLEPAFASLSALCANTIAVLQSPAVLQAWEHWQEQVADRAARLAACPPLPDAVPEMARTILRDIFVDYPDDEEAQIAALRRTIERLSNER